MANRPIFIPELRDRSFVRKVMVDFEWFPGVSLQQKQRSIESLHTAAERLHDLSPLLEISSKSPDKIGVDLSAFSLTMDNPPLEHSTTIEAVFQGSKVFELGGPFTDMYLQTARAAKKDPRLQSSGKLRSFQFGETSWKLEPETAFYDWLYLLALQQHEKLAYKLLDYKAFSDIEFNPKRSVNCQARSAALFVSLTKLGLLHDVLESPERYLQIIIPEGQVPKQM
ncbi:MAG: DUF6977 family protein [Anaerolineales bacterium]|jgi:hypothetical protein